ncbi:MAG: hypothetical protein IPG80_12155 [Anaerolineales bacterium]|uniref:hypothetical protein n=1 Tax=Candidatus Villigracilis vicinus TaxID=3140679 RepID=UPI003135155E|nr:hypothetical protein [Anaerolineales bacterium]
MDKRTIRALGRTIGDVTAPVTLGFGLGLTIAPNLIDNIKNLRSPARITADIMIDTFGFVLSEAVGIGVGLLVAAFTGNIYIAGVSKIGADIVTSVAYDTFIDSNNVREVLEEYLTPKPSNIAPVHKPTPSFDTENTIGQETPVPLRRK